MSRGRERLWLVLLLAAILSSRLAQLNQPIVENYVGRQVPTAMVARNLDRGSGFLRPELDTGPFPNYFLVEPPIFAALAVGVRRASGLAIEPSGRAVSALATTLAAWAIFNLTRQRQGPAVALLSLAAFGLFPVTIRYGRAFQPDMTALALILAGLALGDRKGRAGRSLGAALMAVGLGMKVIFAYALVPWAFRERERGHSWRMIIGQGLALLAPAALWYGHAATLLESGSRASMDNAAIWLRAFLPIAWFDLATVRTFAWIFFVRAFTPIGLGLALFGIGVEQFRARRGSLEVLGGPDNLLSGSQSDKRRQNKRDSWFNRQVNLTPLAASPPGQVSCPGHPCLASTQSSPGIFRGSSGRFWNVWAISAFAWLAWLAGKAHHEYYWLALAPPLAVGLASGLMALADWGRSPRRAACAKKDPHPNPLPGGEGESSIQPLSPWERVAAERPGEGPEKPEHAIFRTMLSPRKALVIILGLGFAGMSLVGSTSTWRTPQEWRALERAVETIQSEVPEGAWLIAPEALIYASDRRGCRLETQPRAVQRAAGEWSGDREKETLPDNPEGLVRFYREQGARYFADLGDPARGRLQGELHEAIRREYDPIVVDEPGFLLILLTEPTQCPPKRLRNP